MRLFITRHGTSSTVFCSICALRQLLLFYYIIQQAQCLHCQKPKVKKIVWQAFVYYVCMFVVSTLFLYTMT